MDHFLEISLAILAILGTLGGVAIGSYWSQRTQKSIFDEGEKRDVLRRKSTHLMEVIESVDIVIDVLENASSRIESNSSTIQNEQQTIAKALKSIIVNIRQTQTYNSCITDDTIFEHIIYEVGVWDQGKFQAFDDQFEFWIMDSGSGPRTSKSFRYPQYKKALQNIVRADLLGESRIILDWDRTAH